jgi:hypothetical protein
MCHLWPRVALETTKQQRACGRHSRRNATRGQGKPRVAEVPRVAKLGHAWLLDYPNPNPNLHAWPIRPRVAFVAPRVASSARG